MSTITITPTSGTGETTLTIGATSANKARTAVVTSTFTASGQGIQSENSLVVTQEAKGPYLQYDNGNPTIGTLDTSVTVTGETNLDVLKLYSASSGLEVTAATVNDVNLDATAITAMNNLGYTVVGDPGATDAYRFSITIGGIPTGGTTTNTYTAYIGNGVNGAQVTITQTGTQPTESLMFSSTIAGDYSGNVISVTINSDGTGYVNNPSRILKVETDPGTMEWTITASS